MRLARTQKASTSSRAAWWQIAIVALAFLKIVLGLVIIATGAVQDDLPVPIAVYFLNALVFGAVAGLLILGRGGDRRAYHLGAVFALFGSVFANRPFGNLVSESESLRALATGLVRTPVEAFLPYFLWRFLADFPRETGFGFKRRLPRLFITTSLGLGVVLFAASVIEVLSPRPSPALRALDPDHEIFWPLLILLSLPGYVYSLTRVRRAPTDERRRVRLFLGGIVIGFAPMAVEVLLEQLVPSFQAFMNTTEGYRLGAVILYPLLLLAPITTAYSVLVHRALGIRLTFRKAIQYALVRYAFFVAVAAPTIVLIFLAYRHRHERLVDIVSGRSASSVLLVSAAALLIFLTRHRTFNTIDRWFFREEYDARRVLTRLIEKCREAERIDDLSSLLVREVEGALHPQGVALFTLDAEAGHLVSSTEGFPSISSTSFVATLLKSDPRPLSVDLEDPGKTLRGLPEGERLWVADGGFRLLVPLPSSDGALLGLLALREKKSDLPYSREDRSLLMAIATAGALNLEKQQYRWSPDLAVTPTMQSPDVGPAAQRLEGPLALECVRCHRVTATVGSHCECGGALEPARIPLVLAGKFQFDRRVGEGGMGVVYHAVDLTLGREVAVKTLPRMSTHYALRLRREARAIASVAHPNLATIFGAETWRGTPMLIFEYLGGGTVADKLEAAPLPPLESVELGVSLAEALDRIHAAGVLHCDVKPSNIGYTSEGVPKLMDFGLARILLDSQERGALNPDALGALAEESGLTPLATAGTEGTPTHHVVGTPHYLSPEAVLGQPLDVGTDLWAAAMVIYEAVAGRHPLAYQSIRETLRQIADADIPDIQELQPDCPEPLAAFLGNALSRQKRLRPASAKELKHRLLRVRAALS